MLIALVPTVSNRVIIESVYNPHFWVSTNYNRVDIVMHRPYCSQMQNNPDYEGRLVGYMRVSTDDQDFALQEDALVDYGVERGRIFSDKMTGTKMDRAGLRRAVKVCDPGDTLVIWKLDRLGRSTIGVLQQLQELDKAGIRIVSLTESLDTQSPIGRFVMTIIIAFAQMERDIIAERTKAGIKAYVDRGGRMGPLHPILDNEKRLVVFDKMWRDGDLFEKSVPEITKLLNAADKRAKKMSTQSFHNWRSKQYKGYQRPVEVPVGAKGDDDE